MRLLIQSSNRWSIELTSAKHHTVDCSTPYREPTLTVPGSGTNSNARSSDTKGPTASSVATSTFEEQKIGAHHASTPPRRKSIRKRLGQIFVHIKRGRSAPTQEIFEYRYSPDASELPAGGLPTAGSATLEEMPASSPMYTFSRQETFELEQPQSYPSADQYAMSEPYHSNLLSSHHRFHKQGFSDDFPMYQAPAQVATPKSLPRLAVPGSIHSVPAMTFDQSPNSASSISPNTPVGRLHNGARPWYPQSGQPLVSPCDATSTLPWYRPQPQTLQAQHSFASPLTPNSAGSLNSGVWFSAHPRSDSAKFSAWPQPGPDYLRSAFPQRYQPINHESNAHLAASFNTDTWGTEAEPHQCCQHDSHTHQNHTIPSDKFVHSAPQYVPSPCDAQSRTTDRTYNKPQLLPAIHVHDMTSRAGDAIAETPPPAYTSAAANLSQLPPATCEHCGKIFKGKYRKGNMTRHIRQVHESLLGGATHLCRFCMKTYNRADALRKHSWKKHRDEDSRPNKRRRS